MTVENDIEFVPVNDADFEDFKTLRKKVIRPHVENQGLPWIEENEDRRHRELFDQAGLRAIIYQGKRVGYVGVAYDPAMNRVVFSRFCLAPEVQGQGIGRAVLSKICAESEWQDKTMWLEVLLSNPVARLYERLGFARVREDEELAYYEKKIGSAA